ncbi:amino acid adenylation domain-containing protein [Actinophytocola sp.]|uniref:amino acid adenylation domain-containing protein n=1 Tax=Actinophytocola sp. TaxID=1872138 RepID=UPI002ED18843
MVTGQTVHERVAGLAEAMPDHIALVWEDGELSYRGLVSEAARLAHLLVRRGVGRDSVVGISAGSGPRLVIAQLAILQSGAAYLPLDPGSPPQHNDFLVSDGGCSLVLADQAESAPGRSTEVIVLDDVRDELAGLPSVPPDTGAHGADLAYVLYTSGSTGRPKGVRVEHRSVLTLVDGGFALADRDQVYCAIAAPTFDAATFEVWGCLGAGGRLVVPKPGLLDPYRIADLVTRFGVTVLYLSKGLFNVVVDTALDGLTGLRQLIVGGDVLSHRHVRTALRALPGTTISNGYGPTEATTFTLVHRRITEADTEGPVPIGRPLRGVYVHVLDDDLCPVTDGQEGELVIGGGGVARGYTDAEQTAARFLPDPLVPGATAVVYRTGDRVRRRPDGVVEFLGRGDNQVKIRGFRVELDAVEAALLEAPGVRQACCAVHTDPAGEKWITGYIVPHRPGTEDTVRAHLRDRLPAYMIPTWFVELDRLPLASNGKVDRRALPPPNPGVGDR